MKILSQGGILLQGLNAHWGLGDQEKQLYLANPPSLQLLCVARLAHTASYILSPWCHKDQSRTLSPGLDVRLSRNKPPPKHRGAASAWETEDPVSKTAFPSSLDLNKNFTLAAEGRRGDATTKEGLPTARLFLLFLDWASPFPLGFYFLSVKPLWRVFLTSCPFGFCIKSKGWCRLPAQEMRENIPNDVKSNNKDVFLCWQKVRGGSFQLENMQPWQTLQRFGFWEVFVS